MEYFVYKITCDNYDVECVYVGSTEDLEQRKSKLKSESKNETNTTKLYTTIRGHAGFENWTIEVVESGTCETDFEIKSRERFWFDELHADLNSIRPQVSQEERRLEMKHYYEQNKDKSKQYQSQNKDRIEHNRSQRVHCDFCNCEIRKGGLSTHNKTKTHIKNLEWNNSVSKMDL